MVSFYDSKNMQTQTEGGALYRDKRDQNSEKVTEFPLNLILNMAVIAIGCSHPVIKQSLTVSESEMQQRRSRWKLGVRASHPVKMSLSLLGHYVSKMSDFLNAV